MAGMRLLRLPTGREGVRKDPQKPRRGHLRHDQLVVDRVVCVALKLIPHSQIIGIDGNQIGGGGILVGRALGAAQTGHARGASGAPGQRVRACAHARGQHRDLDAAQQRVDHVHARDQPLEISVSCHRTSANVGVGGSAVGSQCCAYSLALVGVDLQPYGPESGEVIRGHDCNPRVLCDCIDHSRHQTELGNVLNFKVRQSRRSASRENYFISHRIPRVKYPFPAARAAREHDHGHGGEAPVTPDVENARAGVEELQQQAGKHGLNIWHGPAYGHVCQLGGHHLRRRSPARPQRRKFL